MTGQPAPLTQYQPAHDGDKPLVVERCHARVATEGPNTLYYQCTNRPTTSRPMRSIFADTPVVRPVCGTHKRVHDDVQESTARTDVETALRAAITSRFRAMVTGTALDGTAVLEEPIHLTAPRVSLPLALLETLLEAGKPVEEFRKHDLVAFIVRDRDRVRYQGVGRVWSSRGNEYIVADTISGRRYKVPRQDLKRSKPKVDR